MYCFSEITRSIEKGEGNIYHMNLFFFLGFSYLDRCVFIRSEYSENQLNNYYNISIKSFFYKYKREIKIYKVQFRKKIKRFTFLITITF